jgi:uncharacterized membrane protein
MYFLDPDEGRRRRAVARDMFWSVASDTGRGLNALQCSIRNEVSGFAHDLEARFRNEPVDDKKLVERVRARLGRVVSHPRAITVEAEQGSVVLRGPVLSSERLKLIATVHTIPGVKEVRDELEAHDSPEGIPALQGGSTLRGSRTRARWTPATRALAVSAGIGLVLLGRREGLSNRFASLLGVITLARALSNRNLAHLFGLGVGRGAVRVQKTITINRPVGEVFEFWRQFENFPKFMPHLEEVKDLGERRSHWVAKGPAHSALDWTAVITRLEPNTEIAWKSEPGSSVPNKGSVTFSELDSDRAQVRIQMSYTPPAGAVGHTVASLLGSDLKTGLDEGLLRLKSLLEQGKASNSGHHVTRDEVSTQR